MKIHKTNTKNLAMSKCCQSVLSNLRHYNLKETETIKKVFREQKIIVHW